MNSLVRYDLAAVHYGYAHRGDLYPRIEIMKKSTALLAIGGIALPLLTIVPAQAHGSSGVRTFEVTKAPIVQVRRGGHARHYRSPVREFAHWRSALVRSKYSQFGRPVLRNGFYVVRARQASGGFVWLRVNAVSGNVARYNHRPH